MDCLQGRHQRHGGAHQRRVRTVTLVAGNDKQFARVQIMKTLCKHLEAEL
jgi:hypothetical protein